jgi:hypothetical protein
MERFCMYVLNIQNHWVFGFYPLSVFKKLEMLIIKFNIFLTEYFFKKAITF